MNATRVQTYGPAVAPPAELFARRHWYACFTRARHEKRVRTALAQRGFEAYLPLYPRKRQWKDRKKVVDWPLFPSYVFLRMTLRELHRVLATPGVSTVVRTGEYPTPIPEAELENVRRFVHALTVSGSEPDPWPFLREGQWVRVVRGPFEGVYGIIRERRGRKRMLVGLEKIGQGFEVDIAAGDLKPVPAPPGR